MKLEIKLKPFQTPNYVVRQQPSRSRPQQEGALSAESFPLKEVPKETLETMCVEFRREVMRKAGYEP